MTTTLAEIVTVRDQTALHSRSKTRQERAISAFIADFPLGHRLTGRNEINQLLGYLRFTEEPAALQLFAEVSDQLQVRAAWDERDRAYAVATGKIDDLIVAAIRADDEAAETTGAGIDPDEVQQGGIGAPQAHWLGLVDRGVTVASVPHYGGPGQPRIALSIATEGRILTHVEARRLAAELRAAIAWTGR